MPHLNYKRGRFLLTAGVAEAFLGLSYAASETPSRARALGWLPFESQGMGWVLLVTGLLACVAAFRSRHSPAWDAAGWRFASLAPAALSAIWFIVGVRTLLDDDMASTPWSPWASMLVYGAMMSLILEASDWPNPEDLTRPWDEDAGDDTEEGDAP